MADSKNAAPDQEFNDDGSKNPDYVKPKDESESADTGAKKDGADAGDGAEDGATEKKEGEEEASFDDDLEKNPPKIPVRTNLQHIIARKNEKIKKLESKPKEGEDGYVAPETTDEEDAGDNTDLTPEAQKAIEAGVKKAIAPLLSQLASEADKTEFEELVKNEPEAAKYANHIKAYMAHDAYKGVSPVVIYHHLAFEAAKAIGARKRAIADKEAKLNKGGGRAIIEDKGNVGNLPSAEDIADMSDAEFEKMEDDARQGKFLKS